MIIVRWRYENEDRLRVEGFQTKAQAQRWIKLMCQPRQGETRALIVDTTGGIKVPAACKASPSTHHATRLHHATKKTPPAQLQREIDEALATTQSARSFAGWHDGWAVAMDALLEHDTERAAQIVASIRKEHHTPVYAAITLDAPPAFLNALEEIPANVRDRLFKSLKALQDVDAGESPMLQFPLWKVDVMVGGDLVKTFQEVAPTAASAISKAKHKMRGGRGFTIGDFKYKAKKTGQMSNVGHATRRGG
jgi:hypothetical protein